MGADSQSTTSDDRSASATDQSPFTAITGAAGQTMLTDVPPIALDALQAGPPAVGASRVRIRQTWRTLAKEARDETVYTGKPG